MLFFSMPVLSGESEVAPAAAAGAAAGNRIEAM
jgi:hypothetical protein